MFVEIDKEGHLQASEDEEWGKLAVPLLTDLRRLRESGIAVPTLDKFLNCHKDHLGGALGRGREKIISRRSCMGT